MAAEVGGMEAVETECSLAASPAVKLKPSGEGSGVVERLVKPGLGTELVVGIGREPIGPTEPMSPTVDLEVAVRDGESAPPGDEVDVTGWSAALPKTGLMPELGDEALFARVGDCSADAAVGVCTTPSVLVGPGVWDKPKGSTPRGEGPLTPVAEEGVPVPP